MEQRFESFTVLINRISRNIKKIKNQEMAEYGLRSVHVSCLYYLYGLGQLTATELCERCEEDKATVSRGLEFLEREGFLTCQTEKSKRYKAPLVLTPKGKEAAQKIHQKINWVLEQVGTQFSEQERITFYEQLTLISNQIENITNQLP